MDDDLSSSRSRWKRTPLALLAIFPLQSIAFAAETTAIPSGAGWWLLAMLILFFWIATASNSLATFETWRHRQDPDEEEDPRFAQFAKEQPRYLSALLVLYYATAVSVTMFSFASMLRIMPNIAPWIPGTLGGILAAALLLVFGELLPKGIVTRYAAEVAKFSIRPIALLSVPLRPIVALVTSLSTLTLRLFQIDANTRNLITETELRHLLKNAEEIGVIEEEEQDMIQGIIDLEDTTVREIMTPRVDVSALPIESSYRDVIELQREDGFSRIPVFDDSIDNIIGLVYTRDLVEVFRLGVDLDKPLQPLITPVERVPESLSVRSLLGQMRQKKNHFAVVIDEFGGTAGVVTLEDVIEEITGEIQDEYDDEEIPEIKLLSNGNYHILGSTHIEDVSDDLEVAFDEDGDFDTIAGFLIQQHGEIPQVGSTIDFAGWKWIVIDADERRVTLVEARPLSVEVVADDAVPEGS